MSWEQKCFPSQIDVINYINFKLIRLFYLNYLIFKKWAILNYLCAHNLSLCHSERGKWIIEKLFPLKSSIRLMSFTSVHLKKCYVQGEYTIICKLHGQKNCLAA